MWIAKQAVQVALPPNWEEHEDTNGNVYFYNTATGKSTLKHPMDDYFFALVLQERGKLNEKQSASSSSSGTNGSNSNCANGRETCDMEEIKWQYIPFIDQRGDTYYVNFSTGMRG